MPARQLLLILILIKIVKLMLMVMLLLLLVVFRGWLRPALQTVLLLLLLLLSKTRRRRRGCAVSRPPALFCPSFRRTLCLARGWLVLVLCCCGTPRGRPLLGVPDRALVLLVIALHVFQSLLWGYDIARAGRRVGGYDRPSKYDASRCYLRSKSHTKNVHAQSCLHLCTHSY